MDADRTILRTGRSVAEILAAAELGPEVQEALTAAPDPPGFVKGLLSAEAFSDAVSFLAHALPRREGIWWAWLCAREAAGEEPAPEVAAVLEATHAWIAEPQDARGRFAFARGEEVGLGTPWGLASLAVLLSGSSVAPENVAPIPPGPWDWAKAVAGAVSLAAAESGSDPPTDRFRAFVEKGLAVADRTKLWAPEGAAGRGPP